MATRTYSDLLKSGGFQAFLWTQFLGAFNDNLNKIVLSLFAMAVAPAEGGRYIALAGAIFIAPFLLFSGYAGHLADARNKRSVLIATKAMEVFAMALALAAFFTGRLDLMFAVLFLLAVQATLFSPAKYGILPEMLEEQALSRANGLLEMSTFAAIVLGTAVAGFLFAHWQRELWRVGVLMLALAIAGSLASFKITRVPDPSTRTAFRWNPLAEVIAGFRRLGEDKPLRLTVLGISYFWFLGALLQMDLILFAREALGAGDVRTSLLVTALAVGIGLGSVAAGALSGDRVELGLVPFGSVGMGIGSLLLARSTSFGSALAALALLGFTGGLFAVPLNALLQHRSGAGEKGRLIAANNFANTIGILLASAVLWLAHERLHISAAHLILIFGALTLAATAYIANLLPYALVRFCAWALTHSLYRIRASGLENLPAQGPALLVSNHVCFVDAALIGASVSRPIRFVMHQAYYDARPLHWLFRLMEAIPISGGPKARSAINCARQALAAGELVCVFAEGALSRTGNLLPFHRGFEFIAEGLGAPVVPVHLDGVWGSIFSYSGGRVFWKWPQRIPYPVAVSFGAPLAPDAKAWQVRQAVMELGAAAAEQRERGLLDRLFVRSARRHRSRLALADSGGRELTYGRALTGALLLARRLRRQCGHEEMVGILLPASVGGALANIAVTLAGKVAVNLNFSLGREQVASAVDQCGIRTILTSKAVLEKTKLGHLAGAVFLEDLLASVGRAERLWTALAARVLPCWRRRGRTADSLAAVIFTSGSTGAPKGVMLTHRNLVSNIESVNQIYRFTEADGMTGVLPFFHSFGLMATLWFPLVNGFRAAFHHSPTDSKTIGELVAKYRTTVMVTAPTFASAYVQRCTAEQFRSLRYVIVGAEKLRPALATAFQEKFGIPLLEGYGATEMSPIVCGNGEDFDDGRIRQCGHKPGTVGHPLPGVAVRIVDLDSGEVLPPGRQGLLLVRGPNRMLGYLGAPEKTGQVLRDGWYVTGDLAIADEDGFLRLTGRLSRFSKIGGEMVPHETVEEHISAVIGDFPCAVIGVPDDHKGERLVALHTNPGITADELWARLSSESGLPRLWIPKRDDIVVVDAIPKLGSGKLDLVRIKLLAMR